jgi:GT2 family glycosyltransferase
VQAAITDLDAEIIVVDNLSSDDSCKMVNEHFPEVTLIQNKENYGFSKGNNIGVTQARGEYICILNPDTVVAEDTFKILINFAESMPRLGVVGCKLIDGKGHFLPESKRNVPTPRVSMKKILGNSKPYYANHLGEDEIGEVAVLVGAFMLLKRSVYNEVKGFDEDYFMYGDDMDFSYRISKAGYQNYYNPTTTILHYKGESTLKDKEYAKSFNDAMRIFFKKHFKPNAFFNVLIWLGIKGIILFNLQPKQKKTYVDSYVLISDGINKRLQSKLAKTVHLYSIKLKPKDRQQVILDNNFLSFKRIINFITTLSKEADLTFKILPKTSEFLIGSNSSKSRGEVIKL